MKKNWIVVLTLVLALALFCTACGGSKEPAPTAQAASPTQLPTATKGPQSESSTDGMLTADDNTAPELRYHETDLANMSEAQRKVEEELIGATVEELYAAIGQPKSAEYTTSCLVADGQDGILQYDGFTVGTTIFPNGTEYVRGTDSVS